MTLHRCHYFSPESDPKLYACSCGKCDAKPSNRLLQTLDQVRHVAGIPFVVTSGPRCSTWNNEVNGAPESEHVPRDGEDCTAADIACTSSRERFLIVSAAIQEGVTRIGIANTFVHLGVSSTHTGHVIWTY
jgi:hypothetical protein